MIFLRNLRLKPFQCFLYKIRSVVLYFAVHPNCNPVFIVFSFGSGVSEGSHPGHEDNSPSGWTSAPDRQAPVGNRLRQSKDRPSRQAGQRKRTNSRQPFFARINYHYIQ